MLKCPLAFSVCISKVTWALGGENLENAQEAHWVAMSFIPPRRKVQKWSRKIWNRL